MQRLTSTLILVLAFSTLAPAQAVVAADDRDVARAMHFRESMGFKHGRDVAVSSLTDGQKYSETRWGVPLTKNEATDMDDRMRKRDWSREAIDYAEARSSYGGMYFDQKQGGEPVFLFTSDVAKQRAEIEGRAPSGLSPRVERADYTHKELKILFARIADDMESLQAAGIPVIQVGASPRRNRVMIGLASKSASATAELKERYGPRVATEVLPRTTLDCTRGNCRNPLKGGLRITLPNDHCTSAFLARRDNNVMFVLTAGRCIAAHGGPQNCTQIWKHNGNRFGCAKGDSLGAEGSTNGADVGWIKIDGSEDVTPGHKVLGASNSILPLTGIESSIQDGEILCRSGAGNPSGGRNGRPKWDCGEVINPSATKWTGNNSPRWKINKVAVVDFDSVGGDSGAPYLKGVLVGGTVFYRAAGIHSHSSKDSDCNANASDCKSWFTKMTKVENPKSGVVFDVCTSSGC